MDQHIFLSHHFHLSSEEEILFERFLMLFITYNTHTNLSAIRDEAGIIEKHFVDSLYGASVILDTLTSATPKKLLDIGSGGGFPGIPLKIAIPELQVTLLDSVGKKVKAMNHFVSELGLENIHAVQARAEDLAKLPSERGQYDFVVSRATAYISDILFWAKPFLSSSGKIILYKMPSDEEKKEQKKIIKKLGLRLDGEFSYILGEKERVILVFSKA